MNYNTALLHLRKGHASYACAWTLFFISVLLSKRMPVIHLFYKSMTLVCKRELMIHLIFREL